jgi:hypothetical protein
MNFRSFKMQSKIALLPLFSIDSPNRIPNLQSLILRCVGLQFTGPLHACMHKAPCAGNIGHFRSNKKTVENRTFAFIFNRFYKRISYFLRHDPRDRPLGFSLHAVIKNCNFAGICRVASIPKLLRLCGNTYIHDLRKPEEPENSKITSNSCHKALTWSSLDRLRWPFRTMSKVLNLTYTSNTERSSFKKYYGTTTELQLLRIYCR